MPQWQPSPVWQGKDAFIIGGGHSLQSFDWNLLRGRLTIGCNHAYILGEDIVKISVFGDLSFWQNAKDGLAGFKNPVITNCPRLLKEQVPWLLIAPRRGTGLHVDGLGWNGNTGALAINVALLMGAKRIFLLGFDMFMKDTGPVEKLRSNWHSRAQKKNRPDFYRNFLENYKYVVRDWKAKFSDREIINVTNKSALTCFPIVPPEEVFGKGTPNEIVAIDTTPGSVDVMCHCGQGSE